MYICIYIYAYIYIYVCMYVCVCVCVCVHVRQSIMALRASRAVASSMPPLPHYPPPCLPGSKGWVNNGIDAAACAAQESSAASSGTHSCNEMPTSRIPITFRLGPATSAGSASGQPPSTAPDTCRQRVPSTASSADTVSHLSQTKEGGGFTAEKARNTAKEGGFGVAGRGGGNLHWEEETGGKRHVFPLFSRNFSCDGARGLTVSVSCSDIHSCRGIIA